MQNSCDQRELTAATKTTQQRLYSFTQNSAHAISCSHSLSKIYTNPHLSRH